MIISYFFLFSIEKKEQRNWKVSSKTEAYIKSVVCHCHKEISSLSLIPTRTCQFVIKKSLKLKLGDVRRFPRAERLTPA